MLYVRCLQSEVLCLQLSFNRSKTEVTGDCSEAMLQSRHRPGSGFLPLSDNFPKQSSRTTVFGPVLAAILGVIGCPLLQP